MAALSGSAAAVLSKATRLETVGTPLPCLTLLAANVQVSSMQEAWGHPTAALIGPDRRRSTNGGFRLSCDRAGNKSKKRRDNSHIGRTECSGCRLHELHSQED